MRVAALYDIHGNLPALDAVLHDVARACVDRIVVGGDALAGPMPRETMERLRSLRLPTDFIRGNGERETLAESPDRPSRVPQTAREQLRWYRAQLDDARNAEVGTWPLTVRLQLPGIGSVLFCHATPRDDDEIVTHLMPAELLEPIFDGVADLVVCGHTHLQFDITVGRTRVVNAGSVGMPFEQPGAYWLLLDGGVELRRTEYDLHSAVALFRDTAMPHVEQFVTEYLLQPPDMLPLFTKIGIERLELTSHGA